MQLGGLLAVYAFDELWDVSNYLKYGCMALQHRGLEKGILCYVKEGSVRCEEFAEAESIREVGSHIGVLGLYSGGAAFAEASTGGGEVVLLADREHPALSDIAREIAVAMASSGGSKKIMAVGEVFERYPDAPTLAALSSSGEVVAWRGGLTPLALGSYGFDMAIVASESAAVDILGAEYRKSLEAGEGVFISRHLFKTFRVPGVGGPLCAFELLYLARPDSVINGVSVYQFRKKLGEEVALKFGKDVDIVVGVPETAYPYALGFAQRLGKPLELALIPTGSRQRSMLKVNPAEKIIAIHLKMNPVRSILEGNRIALIDDSMVTGATVKTVSQILRFSVGVEEIHLVIASPPLKSGCPAKVFDLDVSKLLAANLSHDLAVKYLDVDSVTWIDREAMDRVAKSFGLRLCGRCFGVEFFG